MRLLPLLLLLLLPFVTTTVMLITCGASGAAYCSMQDRCCYCAATHNSPAHIEITRLRDNLESRAKKVLIIIPGGGVRCDDDDAYRVAASTRKTDEEKWRI